MKKISILLTIWMLGIGGVLLVSVSSCADESVSDYPGDDQNDSTDYDDGSNDDDNTLTGEVTLNIEIGLHGSSLESGECRHDDIVINVYGEDAENNAVFNKDYSNIEWDFQYEPEGYLVVTGITVPGSYYVQAWDELSGEDIGSESTRSVTKREIEDEDEEDMLISIGQSSTSLCE